MREGRHTFRRVIVEKPFGSDLASAIALNTRLLHTLEEQQIYRIDHYLGKETVQNIMALRFSNGFFEPLWNRQNIDHVQITAAETVGVEQRARFYESTGALRDMVPNHVMQLLAMTAMEARSRSRPMRCVMKRQRCWMRSIPLHRPMWCVASMRRASWGARRCRATGRNRVLTPIP